MPTLTIVDSAKAELISATPPPSSGLAKYLPKAIATQIFAGPAFVKDAKKTLSLVEGGERGLAVSIGKDLPLSTDAVTLSLAAGARTTFSVFAKAGDPLFESTFLGPEEEVPAGVAYVSFACNPTVEVSADVPFAELGFGIVAGTEADVRCYRPFDVAGTARQPTLAEAAKTVLEHFVIPADVDDLRTLAREPAGTIAAVSGHAHLEIGCSVTVAPVFNPLASTAEIPKIGKVSLAGAASIGAGVTARVTGEFQVRAKNVDGRRIRLSVHKMAAAQVDVSIDASAGVGLDVGDRDLTNMLLGGDTSIASASEADLAAAGISAEQLDAIKAAMRAGMSRKLSLELSSQFSTMQEHDAAFLYEVDLSALDATGTQAVARALTGNWADLNRLEPSLPAHGVRMLQSRTSDLREKEVRWRINLVGLVNVLHMSSLVRTGSIFHDIESGEVTITDEVTTERLGGVTELQQVRKLLYETALLTVTYKASGLDINTNLNASQSFFFFDKRANRQRMADYLDAVAAVGLMAQGEVETRLGDADDFGKASLLLEVDYDQAACEGMFLDRGVPRTEDVYQRIGRAAILALVQARDPDSYRRIPMEDDALWKRMLADGNTFTGLLPPPITGGANQTLRLGVVRADYLLIVWWAGTMAKAAASLAAVRAALKGRSADTLETDPGFVKARKALEASIASALGKNRAAFDDPWGLVALFAAADRRATVTAAVVSPRLALSTTSA